MTLKITEVTNSFEKKTGNSSKRQRLSITYFRRLRFEREVFENYKSNFSKKAVKKSKS